MGDSDLVFITCGLGGGCLRGSSLVHTTRGPVKIKNVKKGVVWDTIIPWIIAIVVLVAISLFAFLLKDRLIFLGVYIKEL